MDPISAGLGVVGGLLGGAAGYFGTPDYAANANQYQQQLQQYGQAYNPYIHGGMMAQRGMAGMGAAQMADPAALQNRLASSYSNSPYQNQIMQNTTNQMNANAATTGMMGSTAQQAALQNALAGQQNQFQQQYIDRGTQQYNQANQHLNQLGMLMAQQGFGATGAQANLLSQGALAQMQGADAPTKSGNMLTGAISGVMGML